MIQIETSLTLHQHIKLTHRNSTGHIKNTTLNNISIMKRIRGVETRNVDIYRDVLQDMPSGPLDEYRKQATFNWKKLKVHLEGDDYVIFKYKMWQKMQNDPLFQRNPWDNLSLEEQRRITALRFLKLREFHILDEQWYLHNHMILLAAHQCLMQYDPALFIKAGTARETFIASARMTGTKKQMEFVEKAVDFQAFGCLAITELSHGSNAKRFQTTATFDPKSGMFILNTPNIESIKVWSANLAETATHAVLFAQLITPDGVNHGLHTFFVPLRDPITHEVYDGIRVGDMGPKMGLNGLDNGWAQFSNYKISKDTLLNRHANVTPDGKYVAKLDKRSRHGVSMGILSAGRVGIIGQAADNLSLAISIAIRYAGARRQFGPSTDSFSSDGQEWPILEYQSHQCRLFPYLASAYMFEFFHKSIHEDFANFFVQVAFGGGNHEQNETDDAGYDLGMELHALSAAAKPMTGWIAMFGIQESREACGGHGYLKASRLGDLKADHEPILTYEGDNNVLINQSTNMILKFYQEVILAKREFPKTNLHTMDFLKHMQEEDYYYVTRRLGVDVNSIESILYVLRNLGCHLTQETYEKYQSELGKNGNNEFIARSQSFVFYSKSLAEVFFEINAISKFYYSLCEPDVFSPSPEVNVLRKLCLIYSLWALNKQLLNVVSGFHERMDVSETIKLVREKLVTSCKELKPDALALVDAIAPPDHVLNSILGYSDGKIYDHLYEAITAKESDPLWLKDELSINLMRRPENDVHKHVMLSKL